MNNVIYVAMGPVYLARALSSIASLRAAGYTDPIKLVTNLPDPHVDATCVPVAGAAPRQYKTNFLQFADADAEHVLFLDCDTVVNADISDLWQYDLALAVGQKTVREKDASQDELKLMAMANLVDHLCWNSGVILMANSAQNRALCRAWFSEWSRFQQQDEPSLLRALTNLAMTPVELDDTWNRRTVTNGPSSDPSPCIIRHYGWWANPDGTRTALCDARKPVEDVLRAKAKSTGLQPAKVTKAEFQSLKAQRVSELGKAEGVT